jgi:glycosyltransferase involved in cell wall biosynthesis
MNNVASQQRLKLGIIFNFSENWLGGIFYIINVVKTLDFLDDRDKPEIFLFYNPGLKRFLDRFEYPYLHPVEWDFPSLMKGNLKSWLLRRNIFIHGILKQYPLDVVYPLQDYPVKTRTQAKLISWNADFQYKYYPEFFSRKQIFGRSLRTRMALKHTSHLVLSSEDARNDLQKFFRIPEGLNIHIYHFVSIMEDQELADIALLRERYSLPERYFLVSNQFHPHKNHKVLLQAIAELKSNGHQIHLAITGKFPNADDSPYMANLHRIIQENRLEEQISMMGVISRADQLQLMRHAQAVLQPSLFEGWSTVIEDARSLQVPVVASSLTVNKEQLGSDGVYFDPHKADELAAILKDYPERKLEDRFYKEYPDRVREAARVLLKIFEKEE